MTYNTSLRIQKKTPDDGQRNCPKHAEFYSKNKFEKLVHLVGFYYKNLNELLCIFKPSGIIPYKYYVLSAGWSSGLGHATHAQTANQI